MTRGFLPLLAAVVAAGIGAFSWATEGFRVATSEGARQLAVERRPRSVPNVRLIDQNGQAFSVADYRGRTVLVDFIYTRCPTICGLLGDDFRHVLPLARGRDSSSDGGSAAGAGGGINLLSISFDRANDDRRALQLYALRYGATPPQWRVAAPASRQDLDMLLEVFGVVVIPDGYGGFVHSSSVYLIDPGGRLARILDADAPPPLIAAAMRSVAAAAARS